MPVRFYYDEITDSQCMTTVVLGRTRCSRSDTVLSSRPILSSSSSRNTSGPPLIAPDVLWWYYGSSTAIPLLLRIHYGTTDVLNSFEPPWRPTDHSGSPLFVKVSLRTGQCSSRIASDRPPGLAWTIRILGVTGTLHCAYLRSRRPCRVIPKLNANHRHARLKHSRWNRTAWNNVLFERVKTLLVQNWLTGSYVAT